MDYASSCAEGSSGLTTPAFPFSPTRVRRMHYCDNCRDKDIMPETCKMLANAEAQERIRQNNASLKVKYEALQDEMLRAQAEREELRRYVALQQQNEAQWMHCCGRQLRVTPADVFRPVVDEISPNRSASDAAKKEEAVDVVEGEDTDSHEGRYVWYNGERAPCDKCEPNGRRNKWCKRCQNLLNNSASAKSRRKKEEAARVNEALLTRAITAEIRAEMLMKLNKCKDKVIRDHAWCPDCVKCVCNADGSSYAAPSNAVALSQWPSPASSSYVSVRTMSYAIDGWPSSPRETGCTGAALNFYRNFDSIQYQLAAPATQGLRCNYITKSKYNALESDCILVMGAIMKHNHYEPLVGIQQLGLENELVDGCFQVVMMLHRLFLTSQLFGRYDETHLMLTSSTCVDLRALEPYLSDFMPLPHERRRYISQKMQHWESARRIAMEMAELGLSENDNAFLIFLAIVEEAKRIQFRHQQYEYTTVTKRYRDTLVEQWNYGNYGRPYAPPLGVLAEVTQLVSDFRTAHNTLEGRVWKDTWDENYALELLERERRGDAAVYSNVDCMPH